MDFMRLPGLATGLDTNSLVQQLMSIERRPITLLQNTQKKTQNRIDMYRQINTKLVALQRTAEKVKALSFSITGGTPAGVATATDPTKLSATATPTATVGSYNVLINSLARSQVSGGGAFSNAGTATGSSAPGVFGATSGAGATSGSYSVDVLSIARAQLTGLGSFTSPTGTPVASVLDPSRFTANAVAGATAGSYNVAVNSLAATQQISGGAYTAPVLATVDGTPAVLNSSVTSAAVTGSNTVTVNNLITKNVLRSGNFQSPTVNGTLVFTNATTGASVNVALTAGDNKATVIAKINAANVGMTAAAFGASKIQMTGTSTGDAYTISDLDGGITKTRLRMDGANLLTITAGVRASASVNGGAAVLSSTNTFSAATTGLTGVTINATAAGASTVDVTNTAGTLRITDTNTSTNYDIAVAAGATITTVRDAINAAGTGMTAVINAGKLELTGSVAGTAFTVADAPGTSGLASSLGIDSATKTTRAASLASISIDGGAAITGTSNSFSAAQTGITGVSIDAVAVGSSTLDVTNGAGSLRITNVGAGTSTDVAIDGGATATQIRDAINAANTGMTASISAGKLLLTGATGVDFTVADAAGGNALAQSLGIDSASNTTQTAQLASISIDGGGAISGASNTFSAAQTGLTDVSINAVAVGNGTLTVGSGGGNLRVTNVGAGTSTDVNIAGGATVEQVRDTINAANTGMTASVAAGKLTLTGNTAGSIFTIADAGGGDVFAQALGIDSVTKTTQAATLASISIDGGAAITGTSNTFVNPISGVTINALTTGATTLNVSVGTAPGATDPTLAAVRDMVAAFNDVASFTKQKASYDPATKSAGVLFGDITVNSLNRNLARMITGVVDESSTYGTANSVGITMQRDGTLAFDETEFTAALTADSAAVKDLFSHEDGLTYADGALTVKRNSIGTVGTVGDGLANRLAALVDQMVSSSSQFNGIDPSRGTRSVGGLLGRIQASERSISDSDKRIQIYEDRHREREKRILTKLANMEKAVARMRSQGNSLSGQFFNLGGQG